MSFFDLFKSKKNKEKTIVDIFSPIDGKIIPLSEIPDGAYAGKMMGDGCGIEVTGNNLYCPVDGDVIIFGNHLESNHVIDIQEIHGLSLFFHIGIAKISFSNSNIHFNGERKESKKGIGIKREVENGEYKKGDKLLSFNLEEIKKHFSSMKSPFLISNMDMVDKIEVMAGEKIKAGDLLMRVTLK